MNQFDWAVIGAGPAGIAAVGKLLDAGIHPENVVWIDPVFRVGDLGEKWYRVPGNTKVKTFLDFLRCCNSFEYGKAPDFPINTFNPDESCRLSYVSEALQWVTGILKNKVLTIPGTAKKIESGGGYWSIELDDQTVGARQVILATGCEPRVLPSHIPVIPAEIALCDKKLQKENLQSDTVAVFGASHSAVVALKNLLACNVKKVINFYRHPMKYAVYLESFTLFDNTGLKGGAAAWSKRYIDGRWPDNLERVYCNSDSMKEKIAECTKVIYTIGFEQRDSLVIHPFNRVLPYNNTNGIIAPGLFGIGIAYPNQVTDPLGNIEYNVGLWKFMLHLDRCLPIWMRYCP